MCVNRIKCCGIWSQWPSVTVVSVDLSGSLNVPYLNSGSKGSAQNLQTPSSWNFFFFLFLNSGQMVHVVSLDTDVSLDFIWDDSHRLNWGNIIYLLWLTICVWRLPIKKKNAYAPKRYKYNIVYAGVLCLKREHTWRDFN